MKLWRNYRENQAMSLKILIRFPLESCCWKNVLWVNFHSLSGAVFCMNQLPGENVVCLFCTTRLRQHLHIKLTRGREREEAVDLRQKGKGWGEDSVYFQNQTVIFIKLKKHKTKQTSNKNSNQPNKKPLLTAVKECEYHLTRNRVVKRMR